jgi:hypothetical protein
LKSIHTQLFSYIQLLTQLVMPTKRRGGQVKLTLAPKRTGSNLKAKPAISNLSIPHSLFQRNFRWLFPSLVAFASLIAYCFYIVSWDGIYANGGEVFKIIDLHGKGKGIVAVRDIMVSIFDYEILIGQPRHSKESC